MIEGINKVHHMNFLDNNLPDKCAQLIIADPPYFEVKGDFDFIWKSFEDYLKDVEKWAIECKRLLADNGTLFWYGHAKKIAYAQIIFDKYFNLENNIAIEFNRQTKKGVELFRCFAPVSERLLMYSSLQQPVNSFAKYLSDLIEKHKLKMKDIQVLYPSKTGGLTGCVSNWINGDNVMTEKQYEILQKKFGTDIFNLNYDFLISEYEIKRRPFNNFKKLFDVMSFDQEAHITCKYEHETCKPETLTRALILTCSRPNDLVLVPFAGSGTECAMAVKENRNFWACDIEKKYVDMSNNRCREHLQTQSLF